MYRLIALARQPGESARKTTRLKAPLEVVDDEGRPRLSFVAEGSDSGFNLYDAQGRALCKIAGVGPATHPGVTAGASNTWGGGYLALYHSTQKEAFEFSPVPDGVKLQTSDQKGQAILSAISGGRSRGLSFFNEKGERTVDLGAWDDTRVGRLQLLREGKPARMIEPAAP